MKQIVLNVRSEIRFTRRQVKLNKLLHNNCSLYRDCCFYRWFDACNI